MIFSSATYSNPKQYSSHTAAGVADKPIVTGALRAVVDTYLILVTSLVKFPSMGAASAFAPGSLQEVTIVICSLFEQHILLVGPYLGVIGHTGHLVESAVRELSVDINFTLYRRTGSKHEMHDKIVGLGIGLFAVVGTEYKSVRSASRHRHTPPRPEDSRF